MSLKIHVPSPRSLPLARYEDISHAHIHIGFNRTTTPPPYPPSTLPHHRHTTLPLHHPITVPPHHPPTPVTIQHPTPRLHLHLSIEESIQPGFLPSWLIWYLPIHLIHRCKIKHPTNLNSLNRIICFTSSLIHLFNCFLIIISPTHRSHRLSHHLALSLSHHPITHRLSFVPVFFLLYHHLHHQHLSQHKNITSSHHHPLFSSSHAMISTLTPRPPPPIPTFHASFFCMSRSVPSPLLIHTSAVQHQHQHASSRSLSCKVPFLVVSVPVPTCKVLFLVMQGSVPCKS